MEDNRYRMKKTLVCFCDTHLLTFCVVAVCSVVVLPFLCHVYSIVIVVIQDWRRRYFILKGSKLFFSKTDYSAPHGMIDLSQCTTVKSADLKSKKRNSFEISTPETTFLLYADTEKEKDDWIGSVGKSIVRCSNTYYQQAAAGGGTNPNGNQRVHNDEEEDYDDDDIYENDSNNEYFND